MNKEMREALEADAEKLTQLTGEKHEVAFVFDCEDCIGMRDHGCYCSSVGAIAPGGPIKETR